MVCCKQRASLEQTTGHTAPSKNSWNSVYCTARVRNSRNDVSPRAVTYPSISTPLPCVVHRARGEASLAGCARVLGGGGHRHCLSSSLIPSLCRVTCWRCAKRCAHGGWYKVERWHTWLLLRSGWCDVPRHQKGGMLRGNNRCGRDNARPSIPPSGRATGNDAECVAASTQSFVFHWFLRCGRRPPRRG